jgi:hypothetical protein
MWDGHRARQNKLANHPMRPGDNSRGLGHVGWAQGTPEQIGKSRHGPRLKQASRACFGRHGSWLDGPRRRRRRGGVFAKGQGVCGGAEVHVSS